MSHTPGPWEVRDFFGTCEVTSAARPMGSGGLARVTVAEVRPALVTEETEANARLIAAAPELLHEIEVAVAWLGSASHGDHSAGCLLCQALQRLERVLDKAEGQEART